MSDAPNEGREDTRMIGNTKGKRLAESAFKLVQENKELRDQLSEERENAKRLSEGQANKIIQLDEMLSKEREMRKKLVGGAKNLLELIISENITNNEVWLNEEDWAKVHSCQSIIVKASELDKNKG